MKPTATRRQTRGKPPAGGRMARVYRLRLYAGADLLEEAVLIPSPRLPLKDFLVGCRETLAEADMRDGRVEVVELDPATGEPKRPSPIDRALDELLGDVR